MTLSVRRRLLPALLLPLLFVAQAGCDIVTADLRSEETSQWHKTYQLDANGRLEINNVNGKIEVEPSTGQCPKCQSDLHSCAQCANFDSSATFECQKTVPARISPKDARNECALFEVRTTVERETKSASAPNSQSSAKKSFDDLFK